jgi:glycosyltransferase involved in cell wall biosynthesis
MKVIILMPLAEQRGGAELIFLHLMKGYKNTRIDWLVIFLENGPMVKQVKKLGVKTKMIKAGRLRNPFKFISTIIRITDVARREKVDLIFSWMGKAHFYGGVVSLLSGIPSSWYQHGIPSKNNIMDKLLTILPAKEILTCSNTVAQAQAKIWPKRKTKVVYPAVELKRFDVSKLPTPLRVRKKLKLLLKGPIIGIVGRLQRWKGIHILVEVMPYILKIHPNIHCVIVGGKHSLEPEYPKYLKKRITELKLKDKVILTGFQTNIPEWMQAMDVVVHASDKEPFGIVIIEGMALGKPVVAGANGGPTEIITEGVDGLFAPYGNAKILAKQILRYLDNPKFAKKIGKIAQKRAKDFSIKNYTENLLKIFMT